jgi:CheY-like chemotaxis protein
MVLIMGKLEGRRIFVFEDNVSNRAIIQLILEREGAIVAFERWGQNYEDKLAEFAPIDIILLDLMYPNNVSGFDIFDHIHTLSAFPHVPVVAVSAADAQTAMPKAKAKGFSGFIGKPIDLQNFPEQIKSVLEGHHVWAGF